jgi:hypothetical protein
MVEICRETDLMKMLEKGLEEPQPTYWKINVKSAR